jgi:two-component system cell cycle sensor histidine kinase/response regulator CckA
MDQSRDQSRDQSKDRGSNSAIAVAQLRVLLVGGQEEDFLKFRRFLGEACNGQVLLDQVAEGDALARVQHDHFDLALCDYRSGDGSALRLLQELHSRNIGLPVIILSDHVSEADIQRALESVTPPEDRAEGVSVASSLFSAISNYCKQGQQTKAAETLRKLWHAVEQTADLIVITDRSGIIEYVNPAFEALTGYGREEAMGQNIRLLKSGQQAPEVYQEIWQTVLEGNPFRGVITNRKKNGENFTVEKTITPLRDGENQITHFISTDRDITERHRLEAQLHQAQRMDAIGRLAGGVAHDFNNLLMVISSYAELMLDSIGAQHPLRRNVQEIMAASRRATDLTRQLLAFGRKQLQALQILDLNSVVQEISKMLARLIGEDVQLVVAQGSNLGRVKADLIQMEQVLMNLAANARDAMPEGGRLSIETANVSMDEEYLQHHPIVPPGDYVRLTVTDTGQGIATEHMGHIFELFYTTKESKGTGLGLATVYGIVKQSGGFIWVYSEPGMGTTFKIYLPRIQQKVQQKIEKAYSAPPAEERARGSETVLLAEDEAAVRQSEKEFLESSGYTVLEASDGDDALVVAQNYSGAIHLVITDVVMPHMGGAKLAERLSVKRPGTRVLFVSGYAENTVLRHGAIDLASQFLQKPFTLKSLARKIREVLREGEASKGAAASSS